MTLSKSCILATMLLSSLLIMGGCSIDSLTTGKSEMINGIVVPPEPDETLNNVSLAGVDSNNNSVRDDVERKIAAASTAELPFDKQMDIARIYGKLLYGKLSEKEITDLFIERSCYYFRNWELMKFDLTVTIVNTEKREQAYSRVYLIALKNGYPVSLNESHCKNGVK